jgi:hypothetical protein
MDTLDAETVILLILPLKLQDTSHSDDAFTMPPPNVE